MIEIIHNCDFHYDLVILLLALLFDALYPFHRGFLLKIHPVHSCYVLATKLIKPHESKVYGILLWLVCILSHISPIVLLMYVLSACSSQLWHIIFWIITAVWFLKTSFSIRLLIDIGLNVYNYALCNDLDKVRYWVQQIVRRDVYSLDKEHVLSACIESIAESLVDGTVSPLFYYPFFGIFGPLIQRLSNTLDGVVGFKTPELKDIGWFSALMDSIINFIPARLTAVYIILSSAILGYNWRNALRIYLRDRRKTDSINAGHPMSAMAGALGVCLEKVGYYRLGDKFKTIEPSDVFKAIKIALLSTLIHLLIIAILLLVI